MNNQIQQAHRFGRQSSALRWMSLAMMLVAGCSDDSEVTCQPVEGQIVFNGKPLAEAMIVFHPVVPAPSETPKPVAYTDAEGRFSLTTFETRDGALPGEYTITVELRAPRLVGEETVRDGRNLLPARYGKPGTSGLRYKVVAGANKVPTITIAAR